MSSYGRVQELGHQGADVRFRPIKWTVIVFAVIFAAIHLVVWRLYRYVQQQDKTRDVRRSFVESVPPVPPPPRLQVYPREDLHEYLRAQQERLESYGWVSRPEGRVRIPIERAMEMVVEREKEKSK
jgi:hypothetical protein